MHISYVHLRWIFLSKTTRKPHEVVARSRRRAGIIAHAVRLTLQDSMATTTTSVTLCENLRENIRCHADNDHCETQKKKPPVVPVLISAKRLLNV